MMNKVTRRIFLAGCGGSALAAWAADFDFRNAPDSAPKGMTVAELTLETFEPLTGQSFSVAHPEHGSVTVELIEASAMDDRFLRDQTGKKVLDGFRLLFRGPEDPALEPGVYELSHAAIGACGLLITPVTSDGSPGRLYEVVFNRLIDGMPAPLEEK